MKRLLLFFLMAVIFAIQGWSQTTLNEGFEGTMFPPEGWTKITTQGSETWNREDSPYSNPRGVASASANRSINGHTSYLITPKLSITSNLDSISFWVRCPSNGTGTLLNILLSTTDNSVSSFNPISLLTLSNTNITPIWTRHSIALSNYIGNDIYIAFQVIDNYGMEIMLDDISGPQLFVPSCIRPTSLSVSNITTNSANISWVPANQSDSAFWLYYKENGESNFDSIHVVGSPSYSLTNLNHSTSYNVYLKTDCGSEVSQGTTIYYFSTNCGEITVFPWVENFDNTGYVGSYPPCWHRPVIFDTYPKIGYGGTGNSTKGLEIRSNFNSQTYAITPQMGEDINKLKVGFWAQASNAYNTGSLEVGIMSDPNDLSSFEIVDTIQMFQPTYREYEVSFSQTVLSGTGKYIAFRKSTLYPSEYYRIDDIVVSHITSCASPDSIYVSNISQTEADINIVPNNITDTIWRVYYRTEGTTNWTIDDVHTSQYHLTDLALNTSYEVFATTLCNDTTYSDASNVIKFRTNCNYISSLPYTQNFDTYGTNINYPLCWRKLITDYYKSNVSFSYLPPYGSLEFKAQDNNKALAICTPIYPSIPIDSLIVSFKMNYSTIDAAGIQVGIMSDPNDFSTFVPVGYPQVISQVNVWEEKSVLLSEYQGTGSYITLAAIAPEGQYARAFIDDFLIEYAPTCPNVYELEVKPASTTSVNVNFYDQADNGSGYRIAYATNINSPFNPATSTIIPIPTGTALPYIIQGFSPGDSVWVAVQRGCLGSWTNAQKTILPMFSNTLPFICDFEDATVNNTLTIYNGNQTNKWYIGANGANGTGNGLYISSDNGLTAQYSIYDSSSVMVSTLIEFDQSPEFTLSFDWKANGESRYDYLYAYILPPETEIIAGILPSDLYRVTPTYLNQVSSWQRKSIPLGSEYSQSVRKVVFAWHNDRSNGTQPPAMIDNIEIIGLICPNATNLSASNITRTSAEISFTSNYAAATNFWIYWKTQSSSLFSDSLNITQNPYTLTGLLPNTAYDVKVANHCNTELSPTMSILELRTKCNAITTIPYSEDFNSYGQGIDGMPECWFKTSNVSDYPILYGGNNNYSLFFYVGQVDQYNIAAMPAIDATIPINTLSVRFNYQNNAVGGKMIVGVMTDPSDASTFDTIEVIEPLETHIFIEYEVNFHSYTGLGQYIAFKLPYTGMSSGYLDDLTIDYTPSCISPTSISLIGIDNDIDITFTPSNPTDSSWYIYYKPTSSTYWDSIYTNTTTTRIYDLMPYKIYQVYAKTICTNGFLSNPTQKLYYISPCSDLAMTSFPWEEGFERGFRCWEQEHIIGSVDWTIGRNFEYPHTGSNFASFHSLTLSYQTKLISPIFDLTGLSMPYISFWRTQKQITNNPDELKVFYRTSPTNPWIEIAHYTTKIELYTLDSLALPNPSDYYQIAFEGKNNSGGNGISLDDIRVYDASTNPCVSPNSLIVIPDSTTANISWTAGGEETSWVIKLDITGNTDTISSPNHIITGLTPNTLYKVYVRANCGTGCSSWISKQFTTTITTIPPIITTDSIVNLGQTTATFYGKAIENTIPIDESGFEYKISSGSWDDAMHVTATGITNITATANDLLPGTTYQVRTFAIVAREKLYGEPLTFGTLRLSETPAKEISVMMYPNPARSQTNLIVSGINGETKIILSDVQGRILNTINAKPVSGTIEKTIDLNDLAKGVYYIRIQNSDISRTQKLIVK